jgi:hypothetical protein
MEPVNPYSPPTVDRKAESIVQPFRYGQQQAVYFLVASVILSLMYTYIDESLLRTSYGAWPMLIATSAIAIGSVLVTKDLLLSPLCCFAGTVSGDILAGLVRNWGYAQLHYCIPLSIAFSIPSLIIGLLLRRRRSISER